jgi:hypothetical protein
MSALPSKNFSGSGKRGRFKVSLFPAATVLVLVAFDGLKTSEAFSRLLAMTEVDQFHSITSSVSERSPGDNVRPSIFAVLRLITSSNLVGCNTGRSAGLAPFKTIPV